MLEQQVRCELDLRWGIPRNLTPRTTDDPVRDHPRTRRIRDWTRNKKTGPTPVSTRTHIFGSSSAARMYWPTLATVLFSSGADQCAHPLRMVEFIQRIPLSSARRVGSRPASVPWGASSCVGGARGASAGLQCKMAIAPTPKRRCSGPVANVRLAARSKAKDDRETNEGENNDDVTRADSVAGARPRTR